MTKKIYCYPCPLGKNYFITSNGEVYERNTNKELIKLPVSNNMVVLNVNGIDVFAKVIDLLVRSKCGNLDLPIERYKNSKKNILTVNHYGYQIDSIEFKEDSMVINNSIILKEIDSSFGVIPKTYYVSTTGAIYSRISGRFMARKSGYRDNTYRIALVTPQGNKKSISINRILYKLYIDKNITSDDTIRLYDRIPTNTFIENLISV